MKRTSCSGCPAHRNVQVFPESGIITIDYCPNWLVGTFSFDLIIDNFSRPGTGIYFVPRSLTKDETLASFCSLRVGLLFFTLSY